MRKITLPNGLRIVTVPQKSTKTVTVLVLVGTGSKYENKTVSGISHFLEHMFFKGTTKRPTHLEISESLDQVGGVFNAFTGEDITMYFAKVDSRHLSLAIDWVSDIFLNSKLPKGEIEREKGVVIEEMNMYKDMPGSHVQNLWRRLLYGDQPAGWDIIGTRESILNISRKSLIDYVSHQYVASNTVVCVAGNITTKEVENIIKTKFKGMPTTPFMQKPEVIDHQDTPGVLLEYRKTDQTHIMLGARGYNLFHKKRYTQSVLAVLLGGMMSSRMFVEIREKLGLAYSISTAAEADPDVGFFVTQAGLQNENVEKAIGTILKEYKKVSTSLVSPDELKKAKENMKGKMALTLESSNEQTMFYGLQEILQKDIYLPEKIYDKIDVVSRKDIKALAKELFVPEKINLAVLGPFQDTKKLRKLLRI
ncbi:MAG: insulinase family protein [Patescibacteria group bacterium]|nr:insulinase family protein [Patescibacteria group bacterium]